MFRARQTFVWVMLITLSITPISAQERQLLEYRAAPVANPLKGLVPYQGDVRERFPHTLEFNYLPYAALVKGYDEFDWKPLEAMLDDMASRGHQAVLRIFLEYPNKSGVIPSFLLADGLTVHKYLNTNTQPFPPAQVETPDYEDANLRRSLKNFIAAFGKHYDGDPRIGFITAGLLGTWGEWHTHPKNELFASKTVQTEVMDAYEAAFDVTPVLLRYPAGDNHYQKAKNSHRGFGYHDDSFAWATLHTGKQSDEWFYMTSLSKAGPDAAVKWKSHPIGGEIRPEAWGWVFDEQPDKKKIQSFRQCVVESHATWVMDSGMFQKKQDSQRIQRAEDEVRRMGYEFHAPAVTICPVQNSKLSVVLEIENRGVAPFYYGWQPEYALLLDGKPAKVFAGCGTLLGLLPGDAIRLWTDTLDVAGVNQGQYNLAVRVSNPLRNGAPMRFANTNQDVDAAGWLTLGAVQIP